MDSHWHNSLHAYPLADLPTEAELVIVGAGIVGCSVALQLAEAGMRPVLVERDHVASGASGRNGGLLLPGTSELFGPLAQRWGMERATELWGIATDGALRLVNRIERLEAAGLDCGWHAEGGLHVATSEDEAAELVDDATMLAAAGFDCRWLDRSELANWSDLPLHASFQGALLVPGGGCLHSGRMVTALAAAAVEAGARIVEGVEVIEVRDDGEGATVLETSSGVVRADKVIFTTNAWVGRLLPKVAEIITPVRGQVLATAPLPPRRIRGGWSLNHGYEYLQQRPDGRLVLGGMRWTAHDREVGHEQAEAEPGIQARLDDWLGETWPRLIGLDATAEHPPVERRWGGIMGWTPDRMPLIGPVPSRPGLWLACGFSGHGVPFAPLAAEMLLGELKGGVASDEAAHRQIINPTFFDPGREFETAKRP